jgi:hypothetical protein
VDFRVQGFRALNRAGELFFRFQDEHLIPSLVLMSDE